MLASWKESYDKHRKGIKKQRHHFANKNLSFQSYDFSSSHVWMWELDHKESQALKNRRFWTVVLEKTFESPLDCKEIDPVNPKGNQPWIFIQRTDAKAKALILGHLITHLKRPWCWERLRAGGEGDDRGWDGWLSSPTRWTEFEQDPAIGDGQGSLACCSPQSHNELDMTEQLNWIELTSFYLTPSWEKLPCQKLCSVFRAACVQGLVNTEIQRPDWLLYLGWGSL